MKKKCRHVAAHYFATKLCHPCLLKHSRIRHSQLCRRVKLVRRLSERLGWPILAGPGREREVDDLIRIREQQVNKERLFNSLRSTDYHRAVWVPWRQVKTKRFRGYSLIKALRNHEAPIRKFVNIISREGEKLINAHILGILSPFTLQESPIPNSGGALVRPIRYT